MHEIEETGRMEGCTCSPYLDPGTLLFSPFKEKGRVKN